MELYFIRHAIAVDRMDPNVKSDEERWLTEEGIKKMEKAAKGFHRIVDRLDLIYTSPYVRARETAEIVAKEFKKTKMETIEDLAPGVHFDMIAERAGKHALESSLAFVGHEPDMSSLASILLTGTARSGFEMKKGAICCISVEEKPDRGNGILQWLLQPKILRKLAS